MSDSHSVLLTGGTGAVGPAIAADLLASGVAGRIHVLIRPGSAGIASRFESFLQTVAIEMNQRTHRRFDWRSALRPVAGDLSRPQLGLSRIDRAQLRAQTTCIVHAAADTKFNTPPREQREINVGGVRRVLSFARQCKDTPRVLMLSTICTAGRTEGRIFEQPIHPQPQFINSYEQTKWQAEQFALTSDVPLGVARLSIVLGSSISGVVHRPGALHHLMRWVGRGVIPVLAGQYHAPFDVITTEQVGAFVTAALQNEWKDKSIWNVAAGDNAPSVGEFSRQVFNQHFPGRPMHDLRNSGEPWIVSQEQFDEIRSSMIARRDRVSRGALDAISSFVPLLSLNRRFDTTQFDAICPSSSNWQWQQTLARVIQRSEVQSRAAVA